VVQIRRVRRHRQCRESGSVRSLDQLVAARENFPARPPLFCRAGPTCCTPEAGCLASPIIAQGPDCETALALEQRGSRPPCRVAGGNHCNWFLPDFAPEFASQPRQRKIPRGRTRPEVSRVAPALQEFPSQPFNATCQPASSALARRAISATTVSWPARHRPAPGAKHSLLLRGAGLFVADFRRPIRLLLCAPFLAVLKSIVAQKLSL